MTAGRILMIDAGGTIGMIRGENGLKTRPGHLETQVDPWIRTLTAAPAVEFLSLDPLIDSSQIGVEYWNQLTGLIQANLPAYDGIILLHGTDTLAFTASLLAFQFPGLETPIILTGSQRPLEHAESDGWANLALALEEVRRGLPGVRVAFGHSVLPGAHVTKTDSIGDNAFESPFAVTKSDTARPAEWPSGLPVTLRGHRIAVHHFLPGTPEDDLSLLVKDRPRVLVLRTYGSGNAPISSETILDLRRAADTGTLIINHSQCFRGRVDMDSYAAAAPLRALGVVGAGTMTLEALTTKLLVLLSLSPGDNPGALAHGLLIPWCGELPSPD